MIYYKKKSRAKNKILTLNLQFAKSNHISSIEDKDQFVVSRYAVNNKTINQKDISLFDCDKEIYNMRIQQPYVYSVH